MSDPTTRLLADRLARRAIFDRSGGTISATFTQEALADLIEQAITTYTAERGKLTATEAGQQQHDLADSLRYSAQELLACTDEYMRMPCESLRDRLEKCANRHRRTIRGYA